MTSNSTKKIAVFHNFMDNIGGAEMVTLTLARNFDAHVYTTNIHSDQIVKMGFEDVLPRIISIGKIPKMAPFRHQIALWKFKKLNLGKMYDFYIISGDWAISGAVHNHPNLWYVHSPLNELWAFRKHIRDNLLTWWKKPIFDIWTLINRILTTIYSNHVDVWICNSINTQKRIAKYYNQIAKVIYPPIEPSSSIHTNSDGYWLSVNRLTRHKRIEIQIQAFNHLPNERLIIVGSYEKGVEQFEDYRKLIESTLPFNVEIRNWVDSKELQSLYSNCKGFISTAQDEDFGMTVVEAMSHGKPVIAPNEGGYPESVTDNETGILINNINVEKVVTAIQRLSTELTYNPQKYKQKCLDRVENFTTQVFIQKIEKEIELKTREY